MTESGEIFYEQFRCFAQMGYATRLGVSPTLIPENILFKNNFIPEQFQE
jgi:hypothetical protein